MPSPSPAPAGCLCGVLCDKAWSEQTRRGGEVDFARARQPRKTIRTRVIKEDVNSAIFAQKRFGIHPLVVFGFHAKTGLERAIVLGA
jgi:hypothetical protein